MHDSHVRKNKVTWTILIHQCNKDAQNKRCSLGIKDVVKKRRTSNVSTMGLEGAEFEVDIGSHCIDPEYEGGEGVYSGISNNKAREGITK